MCSIFIIRIFTTVIGFFHFFLAVTKQKQNPLNEYYFSFISLWRQEFIQQIALYIQQK